MGSWDGGQAGRGSLGAGQLLCFLQMVAGVYRYQGRAVKRDCWEWLEEESWGFLVRA